MRTPNLSIQAFALLLFPLFAACGSGVAEETTDAAPASEELGAGQSAVVDDMSAKNVVQIAVGSPDHKTLVAAVQHVKYEDVLANAGPFTVYAPTDAAFAALPEGTLDNLLKPENKMTLQDILEYHVALGVMKPESMSNGRSVGMANGDNVKFTVAEDGTVMINDAKVLGTVPASNGLVVVIDKVLLPPAE
ncbi:MAG: fasciclin domain-containing protein [Flavobacteriales bacterium]|nr:fasciclin domain-containing protein [Flavobacteriales bacterium]MBK7484354.1 fasciclin domain-containing protein [Flavobacteriales bacterium]MBP8878653.1 fasciclin domain-containing protein [Flavobacteriales bacterium]